MEMKEVFRNSPYFLCHLTRVNLVICEFHEALPSFIEEFLLLKSRLIVSMRENETGSGADQTPPDAPRSSSMKISAGLSPNYDLYQGLEPSHAEDLLNGLRKRAKKHTHTHTHSLSAAESRNHWGGVTGDKSRGETFETNKKTTLNGRFAWRLFAVGPHGTTRWTRWGPM